MKFNYFAYYFSDEFCDEYRKILDDMGDSTWYDNEIIVKIKTLQKLQLWTLTNLDDIDYHRPGIWVQTGDISAFTVIDSHGKLVVEQSPVE